MFGKETTKLTIEGMTCGNCVAHATRALESVSGVKRATVDLASNSAVVKHKGADVQALLAAVSEAGYEASHDQ